jgi:hypothetical protein
MYPNSPTERTIVLWVLTYAFNTRQANMECFPEPRYSLVFRGFGIFSEVATLS